MFDYWYNRFFVKSENGAKLELQRIRVIVFAIPTGLKTIGYLY
jgi:hypothetical protein